MYIVVIEIFINTTSILHSLQYKKMYYIWQYTVADLEGA